MCAFLLGQYLGIEWLGPRRSVWTLLSAVCVSSNCSRCPSKLVPLGKAHDSCSFFIIFSCAIRQSIYNFQQPSSTKSSILFPILRFLQGFGSGLCFVSFLVNLNIGLFKKYVLVHMWMGRQEHVHRSFGPVWFKIGISSSLLETLNFIVIWKAIVSYLYLS